MQQPTKYIKQMPSGFLYVWTEALAKRSDMAPYEGVPPKADPEPEYPSGTPTETPYSGMTKPELVQAAQAQGIKAGMQMNKDELIALLTA